MPSYKIIIDDRSYASWSLFTQDTYQPVVTGSIPISPSACKLFSDDVFDFDPLTNHTRVVHSSVRMLQHIPAVLIINDGKTYGRHKNKLLYKCLPDDKRIPAFLVPYEIKHVGFFKTFENIFVTIQYVHWNDKHPFGVINQSIGPVDILDNFYEYQLFCKSLNHSIQNFNKRTLASLHASSPSNGLTDINAIIHNICANYPSIEDRIVRKYYHVFSIDPANSGDYDDAFSITQENGKYNVSIYISNVPIILNALNLWTSFSQRISTIYLPDKKRPMLPTILSEQLCSLQACCDRIAFTMDIVVSASGVIERTRFSNTKMRVVKNYAYESADLLGSAHYSTLLQCCQLMAKTQKCTNHINDSHEVVAYLMVLMNNYCAKELIGHNQGIFRTVVNTKEENIIDFKKDGGDVPASVDNFIHVWRNSCGQYVDIRKCAGSSAGLSHSILGLDAYIHISSPIRRLVDLLNMIKLQSVQQIFTFDECADNFYNHWLQRLEYINTSMRSIRKIQMDCNLLALCSKRAEVMEQIYEGYCFDKLARKDGLFQYNVYLPDLKMASRITCGLDLPHLHKSQYKLFLFNNADRFKKKIRLQIVA
jgi:exoribonuclease R